MSDHCLHCRFSLFTREDAGKYFFGTEEMSKVENEKLIRSKQPKIYVIKSEGDLLYVGYASQSLITRLKQGFRATGKNGYHGYTWKNLEKVEVHAFVFPILGDTPSKESRLYFEAIEAELVYLIRLKTTQWPIFQSEIHFNNLSPKLATENAEEIYNHLEKALLLNSTKRKIQPNI